MSFRMFILRFAGIVVFEFCFFDYSNFQTIGSAVLVPLVLRFLFSFFSEFVIFSVLDFWMLEFGFYEFIKFRFLECVLLQSSNY